MVPTRCGHYPGWRDLSGQQIRECTPRLEGARMLEKLKFEAQAGGSQSEIRRIDLYDWSAPDVGSDKPLCLGDRTSINDIVGLHVHGSTPRTLDYARFPRRLVLANTYRLVNHIEDHLWGSSTGRLRS
jgi:hypothetical protein